MNLYLVRHGATLDNERKYFSGWTDNRLSEYGMEQARQLAAFFRRQVRKPFGLYCSDLKRAVCTAEIIGKMHKVGPIKSPLLRELNFGEWEGLSWEQISASYAERSQLWLNDPYNHPPPGGESLREMGIRIDLFLNNLLKPCLLARDNLVITHGGTIRLLLSKLLPPGNQRFWDLNINTASISLLSFSGGSLHSVYINKTTGRMRATEMPEPVDPY